MYRVTKKNIEKNPVKAISWVRSAATSPLTRRMAKGTSGLRLRSSLSANPIIKTADAASDEDGLGGSPADDRRPDEAVTSSSMPPVTSAAPCGVERRSLALAPAVFGISASAPAVTATQIGGFTKKTHRQPGPWEITPPRNTPAAAAIPLTAPQAPAPCCGRGPRGRWRELGERGRGHERGAGALHEPGGDQEARVVGEPGGQRRDGEDGKAGDQHAAAAEQVGQAPPEQQKTPVGEDVAARHPLQVLLREVQAVLDGRQCDINDRRVDDVEELHGAQQQQRERAQPRPQG